MNEHVSVTTFTQEARCLRHVRACETCLSLRRRKPFYNYERVSVPPRNQSSESITIVSFALARRPYSRFKYFIICGSRKPPSCFLRGSGHNWRKWYERTPSDQPSTAVQLTASNAFLRRKKQHVVSSEKARHRPRWIAGGLCIDNRNLAYDKWDLLYLHTLRSSKQVYITAIRVTAMSHFVNHHGQRVSPHSPK